MDQANTRRKQRSNRQYLFSVKRRKREREERNVKYTSLTSFCTRHSRIACRYPGRRSKACPPRRIAGFPRNLDEALVETEVVSDGVHPAGIALAVVWVRSRDPVVDFGERESILGRTVNGLANHSGVRIIRLCVDWRARRKALRRRLGRRWTRRRN